MKSNRYLLSCITVFSSFIWAQDAAELDTVEINSPAEQQLNQPNYQFFSREQLEGRFNSLSDFLQQINGIQIQQMSGLGSPAMASIRGASAQQTKVLINGIESSEAQFGGYDLNQLPINQIESIELIQDNYSGSAADQAIGGTINITTRQQHQRQVSLQAGSYGTLGASATLPLPFNLGLQLERQQSNNDYRYPVPSPAFDSQNRFKQERLNNAEYYRNSAQLAGGTEAFSGRLQWIDKQKNIEDFQRNHPDNNAFLSEKSVAFELYGKQNLIGMNQRWQLGHNRKDEHFLDTQGRIGLGTDDNDYRYEKSFVALANYYQHSQWSFDTDLKLYQDSFTSRFHLDNDSQLCSNPYGNCDTYSEQNSGTLSAALHWHSQNQQHSWHASLYHQRLENISHPRHKPSNTTKHKDDFTGGSLAYQWYWADSNWSLSWKHAARIPTLYERYGNHGLFKGNESLDKEQSDTYSLDMLWHLNSAWQISGALFYRALTGAIVPIYDSRGIGRYENTNDAWLVGVEWSVLYQQAHWFYKLSGSHYDSNNESAVKSFNNKKLPGTYHNILFAQLGFNWQQHRLETSTQISDDLYFDRSNLIEGEQRFLWNASYRYTWKKTEAGVRLNNITDNRFLDFTNRPTIGREWLVFINTRF